MPEDSTLRHRTAPPDPPPEPPQLAPSSPRSSSQVPVIKTRKRNRRKRLINVAPLNIPLNRRLETLGVMWHVVSIPVFLTVFLATASLGVVAWLVIILPYFIWWYGFDLHTPTNGKAAYRIRDWTRNLVIWEWFVNYFPINIHKSCELEPTFSDVLIGEDFPSEDDEEDLVSESSTTLVDLLFKKFGLGKRLNSVSNHKYKKVTSGPRYIFGYHPHGVISMGVMGTLATNVIRNEPFEPPLKFLKPLFHDPSKGVRQFPNIGNIFVLTLTTQFTLPFYRDYLMSLGLTSASARNIKSLINNGDNSVCIVVGGAQEALLNSGVTKNPGVGHGYSRHDADSGDEYEPAPKKKEIQLVLNRRKGFIKLAIETGNINLVPIFGFGEADIYKIITPKPGSFGHWLQRWVKKHFLFTIPFFSARGVFFYDFGFLPFRTPIDVCVGNPIYVPSNLIQEYALKHPEYKEDLSPPLPDAKETLKRNESITDIFKLRKAPKPQKKRVKVPQELLDHYHNLYVDELKRVFEENKHKFGYEDVELKIVE